MGIPLLVYLYYRADTWREVRDLACRCGDAGSWMPRRGQEDRKRLAGAAGRDDRAEISVLLGLIRWISR